MCPPGLHITLGIFLRLFVLLEDACHQLDLSASLQGSDCGPSYERYSAALSNLTNIKDKQLRLQNELNVLEQIVTFTAATAANATTNPLFNNLASTVASMKEKKKKHVNITYLTQCHIQSCLQHTQEEEIRVLEDTLEKGFHRGAIC